MTVHTITLEQQGKDGHRLTMGPAHRPKVRTEPHNRCQHEARSKRGIIRQCRTKAMTVIKGQRLCWRHAQPPD